MRRGLTLVMTAALLWGVASAGLAQEAAKAKSPSDEKVAAEKAVPTPAELRVRMHRTMAALIEARSAAKPDQEKIIKLTHKSRENHEKIQQKLNNLHQSLDHLRLGIKYLIFDLEATRRENMDLRKRLEQNPPK